MFRDSDEFYIVLPSNTSMNIYPNNTTTNYVTELPHDINLQDQWVMSLAEIHIPMNFFHIRNENNLVLCYSIHPDLENDIQDIFSKNVTERIDFCNNSSHIQVTSARVRTGIFEDEQIFLKLIADEINKAIDDCIKNTGKHKAPSERDNSPRELPSEHVRFFEMTNKFVAVKKICQCNVDHYLEFSPDLHNMLGFKSKILSVKEEGYLSEYPLSLSRALPDKLFIYCDLCEPHLVGNSLSPLLRVVSLDKTEFGCNLVKSFTLQHYYPVITNVFRTIEIDIRDQMGERIPFEYGTLTCTLHFKKTFKL